MTDDLDVLAAGAKSPIPATFDGQTYLMSPIELIDLGTGAKKVRYIRYEELVETDMPEAVKNDLLKEVWLECSEQPVSEDDVWRYFLGPMGISFALYLSLRKRHPEITLEKAKQFTVDAYGEALAKFYQLNRVKKNLKPETLEGVESPSTGPNSSTP